MKIDQAFIEQHIGWMIVLIILTVSVGGLVEIVPLYFQKSTTTPVAGVKPYTPLQLTGRDVYLREGCYNCHSQMIRPFRAETERYGHYSVAGEFVYDQPFLWGSRRTGPDLARVGARRVIFCVMLAWGLISAGNAFMQGPYSFYLLRFALGVAEGGFTPSMVFYLTLLFPPA